MATTASVIQFDEATHIYRVNDIVWPGVTDVITTGLQLDTQWYTAESSQRGKAVHAACHYLDEGDLKLSSVDSAIEGYVASYLAFKQNTGFVPDVGGIERKVLNRMYGYCGTFDRRGSMGGKRVYLDLKTGEPKPWHALQTAAYIGCEDWPFDFARFVVQLMPDGESYRLIEHKRVEYGRDFSRFLSVLNTYKLQREWCK